MYSACDVINRTKSVKTLTKTSVILAMEEIGFGEFVETAELRVSGGFLILFPQLFSSLLGILIFFTFD